MLSKKQLPFLILVVLVLIVSSFYAGRLSVSSKNLPSNGAQGRGMMNGITRGQGNQALRGNMVNGEIISQDDKSLTLKLADGGSKLVYFSASTTVSQMTSTPVSDLSVGQTVMINGSANSDGSISAQSIQVRAVGEQFPGLGGNPPAGNDDNQNQGE